MPDLQLLEPFGIRDAHDAKFAVPEVIARLREAVSAAQLTNPPGPPQLRAGSTHNLSLQTYQNAFNPLASLWQLIT
jgi:hypothetical protein